MATNRLQKENTIILQSLIVLWLRYCRLEGNKQNLNKITISVSICFSYCFGQIFSRKYFIILTVPFGRKRNPIHTKLIGHFGIYIKNKILLSGVMIHLNLYVPVIFSLIFFVVFCFIKFDSFPWKAYFKCDSRLVDNLDKYFVSLDLPKRRPG